MAHTNFADYQDDLKRTSDRVREQTINHKVYQIRADEDTGLWMITSKGIPSHLIDDRFTVPTAAFRAIEMWEATQKERPSEPKPKVVIVTDEPTPLDMTKREKVALRKKKLAE